MHRAIVISLVVGGLNRHNSRDGLWIFWGICATRIQTEEELKIIFEAINEKKRLLALDEQDVLAR